ncbi:TM2 domain-containing protein [Nocardioides lianchengensis]|uniref:TM2 domain-containing protein n=1 Tax=Nocardioides lianchengensis TaxID=1045774 RepID=A0A1G6WW48_9ACTN|nr:TM2 domain-containing protein [Nocardioides lianchengensis]NYG09181.1 TM2 domain-containing membrane protein YozV [Nocardioides lianchengensis]SDD70024.1 TM2 domain-containing protein [Nocardioides lianchengensis]
MTQGPEYPSPQDPSGEEPTQPYGARPYGQEPYSQQPPPPSQESWGQQPPPPYTQGYTQPQPGYPAYPGFPGAPYGASPAAPYGIHPTTGIPYSEKSKLVAGLLQILLPLGIGRFYIGDTGIGVAQLLVTLFTCGIGSLWPIIDGIILLASDSKDAQGLMLRS